MRRSFFALALATALSAGPLAFGEGADEPERETTRPLEPTAEDLRRFTLAPRKEMGVEVPSGSPIFDLTGWGMVALSAADLSTTEWGLSRGLAEANPVASSRGLRVLHHVAGPAAVWYTTEKLKQTGRTKLALGLRIGLMAAYGYAALHNAQRVSALP